jgi:hypothetical protein
VPVVAYAAAAVPATMDGAGVLIADKDPARVAAVLNEIASSRPLQDQIICGQDAALARLEARDFGGTLLRFVDQVRRAPRLPRPPIAFDFWEQLDAVEQLEELRVYRPAAFAALSHHERQGRDEHAPREGGEGSR